MWDSLLATWGCQKTKEQFPGTTHQRSSHCCPNQSRRSEYRFCDTKGTAESNSLENVVVDKELSSRYECVRHQSAICPCACFWILSVAFLSEFIAPPALL
jgi:hypothetical protein